MKTRLALGAAVVSGVAGAAWQLFRRPLPRTEGVIDVAGLDAPVEVSRDRWGVPHIRARSTGDLWFAQGFVMAQDRLWQFDLYRRFALGRLAEIAGEEGLPPDRLMRTLGLRRTAERELEGLDPEVRVALDAYAAGVNAAASAAEARPTELQILRMDFEPWSPADSLTIAKLLALGLSSNWERELLRAEMTNVLGAELAVRLDPGYPRDSPVVLEPGASYPGAASAMVGQIDAVREALGLSVAASGSNNWAVSGKRSATGGPLIAGDPHLGPSMPGITYQVGLYVGDRFCRGGSLPGLLGVAFGQGNEVCFTFTNAVADVMDLFVERIDGDEYEFMGERRQLTVHEEVIHVKGAADIVHTVQETHHGPIVNAPLGADDAEPLALAWSALHFPGVSTAHLAVLDVTSGPELVDALDAHTTPVSNLIWADSSGSIGYKTVGRLPSRLGGCPDLPKPGWTGEYEWDGWVPYAEQPESVDPDAGYLVTANNRIEPDGFPHHITSDYFDGYRARRISALIEASEQHDLDGFAAIQMDLRSIPGVETAHRLARLRPAEGGRLPLSQREVEVIERLRSWDGEMSVDSVAATIYQAFTLRLGKEVARAAIGDRDLAERWLDRADNGFMTHVASPWRWQAHLLMLWEEGDEDLIGRPWDELVLDALRGALDDLESRFGADHAAWRWGRVHALDFPHALGAASPLLARIFNRHLEVGGGQETVKQVGWDPGDPFKAIWAPCWRMVADPVHPERSRWQQFTGQSGHVGSPHYDDLMPRWRDGETQPMAGEGPWQTLTLQPV